MSGEETAIIIARNGLSTVATLLDSGTRRRQKRADKMADGPEKKALLAEIKKRLKLAALVRSTDKGLVEYQAELEDIE